MKNSIIVSASAVLALFAFAASAAPVSPERAVGATSAWIARSRSPERLPTGEVRTFSIGGTNAFHLVALRGGGWAAMPADDAAKPLVAWTFDPDSTLPDADDGAPGWAMIADCSGVDAAVPPHDGGTYGDCGRPSFQIAATTVAPASQRLRAAAAAPRAEVPRALTWESLESDPAAVAAWIAPPSRLKAAVNSTASPDDIWVDTIVQCRYNQQEVNGKYCYNYYTPNHWPCGCVATAMAQIMRHFEWPKNLALPYHQADHKISVAGEGQFTTNMVLGALNWSKMPLRPSSGVTDEEREMIGRLTFYCGISLGMKYGSGGSSPADGNNGHSTRGGLKDDFTYGYACYLKPMNLESYRKTLLPSLDAKRPCSVNLNKLGHQVVADGYAFHEGELFIHLNMGWGGSSDSFYRMNNNAGDRNWIDSGHFNVTTNGQVRVASGRVTDVDGNPIAGATVTASVLKSGDSAPSSVTLTTDARGIYAVETTAAAHTINISAWKSGYVNLTGVRTATTGSGDTDNSWGNDFVLRKESGMFVWTGGGSDGKFNNKANWDVNKVPTNGASIVLSVASAQTLNNNISGFKPAEIFFAPSSRPCTISGNPLSDVSRIVNGAVATNRFTCAVAFKTGVEAEFSVASSAYIDFAGGMTAYAPKSGNPNSAAVLCGNITFTKANEDWSTGRYPQYTLAPGTTVTLQGGAKNLGNGGKAGDNFLVAEDATLRIEGDYLIGGGENAGDTPTRYVVSRCGGTLEATGVIRAAGNTHVYPWYFNCSGVIRAAGLVNESTNEFFKLDAASTSKNAANWVIGSRGLSANNSNNKYFFVNSSSNGAVLWPSADYAIACYMGVRAPLTIQTSDYDARTTRRTVTLSGPIARDGTVTVAGCGTAVVAYSVSDIPEGVNAEVVNPMSVTDTATLRLNAGSKTGTGAVSVGAGATLSLPQSASGTATIGGKLTLAGGSTLSFGALDAAKTPLSVKSLALGGSGNVTVAVSSPLTPGALYPLVSGASGVAVARFAAPSGTSIVLQGGTLYLDVDPVEYVWKNDHVNWGSDNAWALNGANAAWTDRNIAVFGIADATSRLAADVVAHEIVFNENATLNVMNDAVLTASIVAVAAGKTATVKPQTAGALQKIASGTLVLEKGRTEETQIVRGTLKMAQGATLDPAKLTLGTAPDKAVALDYGGQALSFSLTARSAVGTAAGGAAALYNGLYTIPADLRVWNGSLTVGGGAHVAVDASANHWICVGGNNADSEAATDVNALLVIDGGSVTNNTARHLGIGDFGSYPSKGAMLVKNGGTYWGKSNIYVAQGCKGTLSVEGAGSSVTALGGLWFCGEARCEAGENGYVVLTNSGVLATKTIAYGSGGGTGYFTFAGGTLRATAAGTLLAAHERLSYTATAASTIDNGGFNVTIASDITGAGALTLMGAGTTTLAASQTGTGTLNVAAGLLYVNSGLSLSRPVAVASGATFTAFSQVAATSLSLASGATVNLANYSETAVPLTLSGSLTLPASGTVTLLRNNAAFPAGTHPVLSVRGITASAAQGKLVPRVADGLQHRFFVRGDVLYVAVGADLSGNVWIGRGTANDNSGSSDAKFSTGSNWLSGTVPAQGSNLNFTLVTSNAALNADIANCAFGAVTMGTGVVTFTGSLSATSFSDTGKLAVGDNAAVTLDGDLLFSNDATRDILYSVAANGKFVVTGTLGLSADAKAGLNPQTVTDAGFIAAGRIVNNAPGGKMIYSVNQSGSEPWSQKWIIGPGGITSESASGWWGLSDARNSAYFYPNTNDFTVSAPTVVRTSFGHYELNTTGFGDGLPHVITLDAGFSDNGMLFIAGTGKVVVNHVTAAFGGKEAYSGAVTVSDTATLAIKAGKKLTNGAIAVASGATLELPDAAAGAVSVGDLTLADGATLSFAAPGATAALAVGSLAADGTVAIAVSGVVPGGRYALVSGVAAGLEAKCRLVPEFPHATFEVSNKTLYLVAGEPFAWTGASPSSEKWVNVNNWFGGAVPNGQDALFLADYIQDPRVSFTQSITNAAMVKIDAGTPAAPVSFSATSPEKGLSTSGKNVAVALSADACLEVGTGTWSFGPVYVGTGDGLSGAVTNNGGTVTAAKLALADHNGATGYFCNKSGEVSVDGWITVGGATGRVDMPNYAYLDVVGGTVRSTKSGSPLGIGDYGPEGSVAVVRISGAGVYESAGDIRVNQGTAGSASLVVENGGRARASGHIRFCQEARATGSAAVDLKTGGVIETKAVSANKGTGPATFNFAGGTLRALADETLIRSHSNISYVATAASTIDNGGYKVSIASDITGAGALALMGGGTTTFAANQTGSGAVTVDSGTLALAAGVTTARPVTVLTGAALALPGSASAGAEVSGRMEFKSGTRLVLSGLSGGVTPLTVGTLVVRTADQTGGLVLSLAQGAAVPGPGDYTIVRRTDSDVISDAHIARTTLDASFPEDYEYSLRIGADKKTIVLSVTAPPAWPAAWNGGHASNAAMQAAYDEWAKVNDSASANAEAAFLLGENVSSYKPLKVTDVSLDGGKFTIGTNTDLTKVNGRLYVLVGDSLATIEATGTKITGTVGDVTKLVNIDASVPLRFFKVGIDYQVE